MLEQIAKLYTCAAINLGDPKGDNNFRASKCYLVLKNYECAFAYGNRSLAVREKILPMFDHCLAETYLVTGLGKLLMHFFDNPVTASKCILNAMVIYKKTSTEGEKLAEAYAALALGFDKLDKCAEAIRLAEKALSLFETAPPKNKFKLACVHGDLGRYLMKVNRFDESLAHLEAAAKIFEELTPQGHLNVALAYRAIGEFYKVTDNFEQAFHYGEKSIQMQERLSKTNIAELGKTYSFIGNLYHIKGHKTNDISCIEKSTAMYEIAIQMGNSAMLPQQLRLIEHAKKNEDNNQIVKRYRNTADCCRVTKQFDEAESYIISAIEAILPNTDSDEIFLTYFSASQIYAEIKHFEKALDYAHRSLDVYKAAYPADEENFLETQHLNIRNIQNAINLENSRQL